jgi:hypothetical protein
MNPGALAGAQAAAASAAARRRREEEERRRRCEEEEVMTGYTPDELAEGWQFKIVKGTYQSRAQVEAVQQEMAPWGWVLVEVFDEARARFKRPAAAAKRDALIQGNPYRTVSEASGPSGSGCAGMVLLAVLVAAGAGAACAAADRPRPLPLHADCLRGQTVEDALRMARIKPGDCRFFDEPPGVGRGVYGWTADGRRLQFWVGRNDGVFREERDWTFEDFAKRRVSDVEIEGGR